VRHPASASAPARGLPPCPVPMMIASSFSAIQDTSDVGGYGIAHGERRRRFSPSTRRTLRGAGARWGRAGPPSTILWERRERPSGSGRARRLHRSWACTSARGCRDSSANPQRLVVPLNALRENPFVPDTPTAPALPLSARRGDWLL